MELRGKPCKAIASRLVLKSRNWSTSVRIFPLVWSRRRGGCRAACGPGAPEHSPERRKTPRTSKSERKRCDGEDAVAVTAVTQVVHVSTVERRQNGVAKGGWRSGLARPFQVRRSSDSGRKLCQPGLPWTRDDPRGGMLIVLGRLTNVEASKPASLSDDFGTRKRPPH